MPRKWIACAWLTALLVSIPWTGANGTDEGTARATRAGAALRASVLGAGGAPMSGASHRTRGTLGQSTPVGAGGSAGCFLTAGFWRKLSIATGVLENVLPVPLRNALLPNTPNPFNPVTTIRYEVADASPVRIEVFDIRGRLIRTLVQEMKAPGAHEVAWDGRDDGGAAVPSGVYLYRLRVGAFADVRKMVLVK